MHKHFLTQKARERMKNVNTAAPGATDRFSQSHTVQLRHLQHSSLDAPPTISATLLGCTLAQNNGHPLSECNISTKIDVTHFSGETNLDEFHDQVKLVVSVHLLYE